MTFAEPVESLKPHATALREWAPRAPGGLKSVLIAAADALDDQQKMLADLGDDKEALAAQVQQIESLTRQLGDCCAAQLEVRGLLKEWAAQLEGTTQVRIGQMDSASRASEKTQAAQNQVLDVVRKMRAL